MHGRGPRPGYGRPVALAVVNPSVPPPGAPPSVGSTAGRAAPIDALYRLVATHELDIMDIALAEIVDAFVGELSSRGQEMALEEVSEFLLYAAILVELKAKSLLPRPEDVAPDEELDEWEMRDVLVSRLLECRAYAAAAEIFTELADGAARSQPREVGVDDGFEARPPDLLAGVHPRRLAEAYRRVMETPEPGKVDLFHLTVDTVSVAEAVQELAGRLAGAGRVTFRQLTAHLTLRMEVIVHFLALLELCKLGRVELDQGRTFGDLGISWIADDLADDLADDGRTLQLGAWGGDEYVG